MGITSQGSFEALIADQAGGFLLARFSGAPGRFRPEFWVRAFHEASYRPVFSYDEGEVLHGQAIMPKSGGFLDVNLLVERKYESSDGAEGIGYDWKFLRRFRLADGAAVATLSRLQCIDEAEDMWVSELLGPSETSTSVIASVAFKYAADGGAYCIYRVCEVDVFTGSVSILSELPAVFV